MDRGLRPFLKEEPEANGEEKDDDALIDAVANRVVRMGLGVPAIFFLESSKPLSFLGSQLLVFLEPFVKTFFDIKSYDRFYTLMENRDNVEKLIQRVEDLEEQQKEERAQRKREKKREKQIERQREKESRRQS
ncbi:MAG: hypothetical protein JSW03_08375 [Candidatus Eiseniibacteriota bacterium]|nr:MAG: hypothetical protein JSW03_08375 [Candidatus Eisenbacteria bacterium]